MTKSKLHDMGASYIKYKSPKCIYDMVAKSLGVFPKECSCKLLLSFIAHFP